jgi:hypothetical protein
MRKMRIAALGMAAAVAVVALYQLPASPFDRKGYPQRPVAQTSTGPDAGDPSAKQARNPGGPTHSAGHTTRASNATAGRPAPQITYPIRGTVSYSILPGDPATIGTAGRLFTFQIGIEGGINGVDGPAFARFVRETYGAPQGWTSGGQYRFRQVGPGQSPDFKLMLVTPATRDLLCGGGFDQYTSCRIGDRVVLNVARWAHGVPNYGARLTAYRQYMINHETGHRLGRGHELCPGPGQPAPVMEQQTLGLHGCTAYSWPYLNRTRYKGRLGQYNDSPPAN